MRQELAQREIIQWPLSAEMELKWSAYRGNITRIEFTINDGPVTLLEHDDPDVTKNATVKCLWASLCQMIEAEYGAELHATNW